MKVVNGFIFLIFFVFSGCATTPNYDSNYERFKELQNGNLDSKENDSVMTQNCSEELMRTIKRHQLVRDAIVSQGWASPGNISERSVQELNFLQSRIDNLKQSEGVNNCGGQL